MAYAEGTSVSVEKSKAELDALLTKYGAAQRFMAADDERGEAIVGFTMSGRQVKLRLPLPKRDEKRFTKNPRSPWRDRPKDQAHRAWEQACRERWRAMVLLVKAKLETIALGLSTVEREFLADVRLLDGRTVHETLEGVIGEMYERGTMPALLLGPGKGVREA